MPNPSSKSPSPSPSPSPSFHSFPSYVCPQTGQDEFHCYTCRKKFCTMRIVAPRILETCDRLCDQCYKNQSCPHSPARFRDQTWQPDP